MSEQAEEIIARAGGGTNFPPHPEGQFPAVCIDVIDRGIVETTWQGKTKQQHKVTLRFWCGETAEVDGEDGAKDMPLWLDAWFTLSLHEQSRLRPFLEAWRGKKFTDEEERGFNIAKLLHAPALIQVSHNETPNRTYANIDSIMKLPKGMGSVEPLTDYVRVKDRPPEDEEGKPASNGKPWDADDMDSDLPF